MSARAVRRAGRAVALPGKTQSEFVQAHLVADDMFYLTPPLDHNAIHHLASVEVITDLSRS